MVWCCVVLNHVDDKSADVEQHGKGGDVSLVKARFRNPQQASA